MKGFDAEFIDLEHYIKEITFRIWEQNQVEDIRRYYAEVCPIETPGSYSSTVQQVIDNTYATKIQMPDRVLLADDVVYCGDDDNGYMSSHRINSSGTHLGDGLFGAPTGKKTHFMVVADCICKNNLIVQEWLVRDNAAIARQIGIGEQMLAKTWLAQRGPISKPSMPKSSIGYSQPKLADNTLAQHYAKATQRLWTLADSKQLAATHDRAATAHVPGGQMTKGVAELAQFWQPLLGSFDPVQFTQEHVIELKRPARNTVVALRYRVQAKHTGLGRYGEPTDNPVELMVIQHAEFAGDKVIREWILIDDVAVWMHILSNHKENNQGILS
jgi:SnoaL-like domain